MPPQSRSLDVSLIGAGNVGRTIAALLRNRGHRIVSIITKHPGSARSYARHVRCPVLSASVKDLSAKTGLLIIAVPDEDIEGIASEVSRSCVSIAGRLTAFHVSGSMTSDALTPIAALGARTFSLHPIQTFPVDTRLSDQVAMMKGVWYGFEGGNSVRPFARSLVRDLGGRFLEVPKEQKNLYHIVCVFASNYPVALIGAVEALVESLHVRDTTPFHALTEHSTTLAMERGAAAALTGPVSRGSVRTVRRHLDELGRREPALRDLYLALGRYALRLAVRGGHLSRNHIKELELLLGERDV